MFSRKFKKTVSILLSAAMLVSGTAFSFAEGENDTAINVTDTNNSESTVIGFETYTDIADHWSRDAFEKAYNDGIIKGFEDNTLRPDDKITQAQMLTIITRALNTADLADVAGLGIDDAWYKEAIQQSIALGIIESADSKNADKNMTRKDAFDMITDSFQLETADPDMTAASEYADFKGLALSEKIVMASLVNNGYINGWDGSLQLKSEVTRAEFLTLLYRIFGQYFSTAGAADFNDIKMAAMLSGSDFNIDGMTLNHNIWLDAGINTVSVKNSTLGKVFVRADELKSLSISSSKIGRLVLASRDGDINLNCKGISVTDIGDGAGLVNLNPAGNTVEITGSSRVVNLEGRADSILISGNYNTVNISALTYANNVVVNGKGNTVVIDSTVNSLTVNGDSNVIKGNGVANKMKNASSSSKVDIKVNNASNDNPATGDATVAITAPKTVNAGEYLKAECTLTNVPVGAAAKVTWFMDGKQVYTQDITVSKNVKPSLNYYLDYGQESETTCVISCKVDYKQNGESYSIAAPEVTVKVEGKNSSNPADDPQNNDILTKVSSVYKGDNTSAWAQANNLSNAEKEAFVNAKKYKSDTKYLVWVNVGTQYASVFEGSQGNWKLIRSSMVSTGKQAATPIGEFKISYKQEAWNGGTYTVKPVIVLSREGLAMHSRIYKPGTTELKDKNNGIGFPQSDGAIRMESVDIQWIYDNAPNGTAVVVY